MADIRIDITDVVVKSTFKPEILYEKFRTYMGTLNDQGKKDGYNLLRKAKEIKQKMKQTDLHSVNVVLGTWQLTIKNTIKYDRDPIGDEEYTFHRAMGCMAKYILQNGVPLADICQPLAEEKGCQKTDRELYLGFTPGTEMFMTDFKAYPLAVQIERLNKKDPSMRKQYVDKYLRQQINGKYPAQWGEDERKMIADAKAKCDELPWFNKKAAKDGWAFMEKYGFINNATAV